MKIEIIDENSFSWTGGSEPGHTTKIKHGRASSSSIIFNLTLHLERQIDISLLPFHLSVLEFKWYDFIFQTRSQSGGMAISLWGFQMFLELFVFRDRDFPNITITVDNKYDLLRFFFAAKLECMES